MDKLTIKADIKNLSRVLQFVSERLEAAGGSIKLQMQTEIAVEELFVNIAHYAYVPGTGDADICVEITENGRGEGVWACITLADRGKPFNPLGRTEPDVSLSAEEREIGGLGIFMAKKSVDDLEYEYRNGQNILRIYKRLS